MKRPCSVRPVVLLVGLALASCTVDGKGLSGGADAGASGGTGPSGSGGAVTSTGGRPVGSGGSGAGAVVGSGGAPVSTGGREVPGSGGAGTGGVQGTGGAEVRTGGAGGGLPPATGGAAGGPLAGTGGAGTGGRGPGGNGGMGTGGRGTGGAATGGAPPACSPMTCPNGCCQSGTCVTTNRTNQRCGSGGMACAPCGACFQCSNAGTCTPEEGARWDVTCVSAIIAATNSGSPWDPGSGPSMSMAALPDPYCQLNIDGDDRSPTDTRMDSLAPVWNESVLGRSGSMPTTALLTGMSSRWSISVYDMDNSVAEEICSVPGHLTATDLSAGTITYTNKQSCTSLTIKVTCAQQN